ncbi:P-loop containing nucleoside triphosphate hydrolase protein [Dunaliella salina]|uniref:P-loop containing nucleoside triphosphate hydrolase protein n=1 Tax=Dunaliella salina TaxID=3046 RepID=A0ABQ7FYN6_DUNSA|nr:P-loop containing nucleoside triphosphate hydrolase protein [Dunaliella salina]|eukprot:KAF5827476.1 P-loop containing nucleoside triphosphate hydrolase protein [Dunaliella salina]
MKFKEWHPCIMLFSPGELDARLEQCLQAVDLQYLLARGAGWEQVQPWQETLSGGEKQRLAMARLLYHQPQYAVLDECTSAVSADGEFKLYEACERSGITLLSIAHRPALKRFHDVIIHFVSDANP